MKKIFALLIVLIAIFTIANTYASDELVSHDFGKFKMDIPNVQGEIAQKEGNSSQTIYAVNNTDGTIFAFIEYWDTSNTNGSKNTTDTVLNKIKTRYDVKDGNIPSWTCDDGIDKGYLVSSNDDTKVLIITSSDIKIQQAIGSIEFK